MISQRAIDLIVECEVTSKKVYEKKYRRPEWPGGRSGVTIAIGYDLGYASRAKITKDWANRVGPEALQAMLRCSGVTGDAAKALTAQVRNQIDIPWEWAMGVFMDTDIPEWTDRVIAAIPGAAHLPPDCLGAVVSCAYNRGASFDNQGDRYREMRAVKTHIQGGEPWWPRVADDLRQMKRLWPGVNGLIARREAEAQLWERGLREGVPKIVTSPPVAPEQPAPQLPVKEAGAAEGLGTGAALIGTAKAASEVAEHWTLPELALLVVGGIAVAVALFYLIRAFRRSQPVTARAKDFPEGAVA